VPTGFRIAKHLAGLGWDYSFLDQRVRALRQGGEVPVGPKAPGRPGPHQTVQHWPAEPYAALIASVHASTQSAVLDTVAALLSLPHLLSFEDKGRRTPTDRTYPALGVTFGGFLAAAIQRVAGMDAATLAAERESTRLADITMALDPARVEIRFPDDEGGALRMVFEAPPPPRDPSWNALYDPRYVRKAPLWMDRTTVIPYEVVLVCGELLASNPASEKKPSKGRTPSGAAPGESAQNENAPSLPGLGASIRNSQPRTNATETSDTSEVREDGISHQVPFGMRGGLPTQPRQDRS
jgi:hypothetical protein